MTIRQIFIICLALCFQIYGNDSVKSQEQAALPRVALTQAPQADVDFDLMGEFVGVISTADDKFEPLGLQLRPLGANRFEAIQFIGGLPGQEGFGDKSLPLMGKRYDKHLVLSGGPWAIFVHATHCLIIDDSGKSLGQLERIERGSPTMGARPPAGALVIFDGNDTNQFVSAKMTEDGLLKAGAEIRQMFQDFNLHLEFRLPYMPHSDDQARGNSGCYIQSRYEVQILDSFAQLPKFNGASSLYRTKSPELNMSLPPLVWQTYDIMFTAPRWAADGTKLHNARITVWHNGVKTQDNYQIPNKTGAGKEEQPSLLPIKLQDHSDPVVFRNIWIVDRGLTDGVAFPVLSPTPEQLAAEAAAAEKAAAEKAAAEKAAAEKAAAEKAAADKVEPNPEDDRPAATSQPNPAQSPDKADDQSDTLF
jgi:Domain of Unknown Function (DUF1080)